MPSIQAYWNLYYNSFRIGCILKVLQIDSLLLIELLTIVVIQYQGMSRHHVFYE
jgi:hypothetical protein